MIPSFQQPRDARPRIEYYPLDSPRLQTVYIDEFPFVIGRCASAALQINSTSVSREHAEIIRTPTGFRLRDLNSTNGTLVNGHSVRDSPLVDGDSVSIADIELTFLCASMGRLQRTLTRPLASRRPAPAPLGISAELAATRGMSEALLLQAIPLEWSHLVDCTSRLQQATLSRILPPLAGWMSNADAKDATAVAPRIESIAWQLAAEHVDDRSSAGGLLLAVTQRDMLDDRLFEHLEAVAAALSTPRQIGLSINWEWATATPETLRLCSKLRERGMLLAYEEFSGGGGCIETMDQAPPDFLMFASNVVRGVADQPRRLQRLEIVQANCEARQIATVLPNSTSSDDLHACVQLGVQLLQTGDRAAPVAAAEMAALV